MKKGIAFLCLEYKLLYAGNFIPSLIHLANELSNYNTVFIFSNNTKDREWIKDIENNGYKVIFISASRSEGFSYCLMESISLGKPSLVSDIKGNMWSQRYNTVLFKNQNVDDLYNKVLSIITDFDNIEKYYTN